MKTLGFILQKEFRQVFRDPAILRVIFMMPLMQLLLLPWAADYEVKNIHVAIVDHDHSVYSRQLTSKIGSSGYFQIEDYTASYKEALQHISSNKADIVLEIPQRFERDLVKQQEANLLMSVNSINGMKAILGSSYLQRVISDFNRMVREEWIQLPRFSPEPTIEVLNASWYNPFMNYQIFMVPGILVVLVTMVGSFLAALNIVKEKEIGTIEQINVTPIKKHHFILGKLIPFWVIGLLILTIGLFISWLVYGIVPLGNLFTIYLFAGVYLLAVLGLGLLVSTICATQQQAMLISFFILMLFILLGGLYTPIESMPHWAQWLTKLNPVSYFINVIRAVVLKGSGLMDILPELISISVFSFILNFWAVINYRKRAA